MLRLCTLCALVLFGNAISFASAETKRDYECPCKKKKPPATPPKNPEQGTPKSCI